jgi:hypothetical protein
MRVSVSAERAAQLGELLEGTKGVSRLVRAEAHHPARSVVFSADVEALGGRRDRRRA